MIINRTGISSRRSKDKTAKALIGLIERDDYKLITTTQICQEAEISRQTFYNNFETKEDVIVYWISEMLRKYISLQSIYNPRLYSEKMFSDMPFSKRFLRMLDENNLFHLLAEALYSFIGFTESNIRVPRLLDSREYDAYFYDFAVSTCVSLIRTWVKNGFRESPATLGRMIDVFFLGLTQGE